MIFRLLSTLPLVLIFGLASLGGWMLAASLFRLRRGEIAIGGLALGLLLQNWLTNILAHWLDLPLAAWLSAFIVLLAGLAAAWKFRTFGLLRGVLDSWRLWLLLALLTYLFYSTGRGLGLFDDYQNLPTVSLLATGDIPPHFALDPSLRFGYHYFALLLSAQVMRLGGTFPWIALDAARGLMIALNLVLAGLWAWRLTRSRLAAFGTGLLYAFATGMRWMLLILPASLLQAISSRITLIGSSSMIAPTLAQALLQSWQVDGSGPIPFPFAFTTGVNLPVVMAYGGAGLAGPLIMLLFLILMPRWRHWTASIPITILLASYALSSDAGYGLLGLGTLLVALVTVIRNRSLSLPRGLWAWLCMMAVSAVLAVLQGGMFTEVVLSKLGGVKDSYFSVGISFAFPPVIVSGHFGPLSLGDPAQLFVALLEAGPLILLLPMVIARGLKSVRQKRWFEAALLGTAALAVPAAFFKLDDRLLTGSSRFMGGMFFATLLYAVPLLWHWSKNRGDGWKVALIAGALVSMLSGFVLFGTELVAIQKPVYGPFLTELDAKVAAQYWNKLEPDALIFDSYPPRTPVIFGRFTLSSETWYLINPEWYNLRDHMDPFRARAEGFDYVYLDAEYWTRLTAEQKNALSDSCVKVVTEVDGYTESKTRDFRRLLDIRACE
jgi:hypothetical protein